MYKQVFFSFHYNEDSQRAARIRNIGVVEGEKVLKDNEWEEVRTKNDANIEKWINDQMEKRSCVIVLIGSKTAGRKWINYEIKHAWDSGKGVVGIYINNMVDLGGDRGPKGENPFADFKTSDGKNFADIVKSYDPPHTDSKAVYHYIEQNIESWVDEAIKIRDEYGKNSSITSGHAPLSRGTIVNPPRQWCSE